MTFTRTPALASAPAIRVLLIGHEPLLCAGLRLALEDDQSPCIEIEVQEPGKAEDALQIDRFDVVVSDYETGIHIQRLRKLNHVGPGGKGKVMIVTWRQSEADIREAIAKGIHGYLLVGCHQEDLRRGVRAVYQGSRHLDVSVAQKLAESLSHESLTTREISVMRLVAQGLPNKAVADRLDIGLATVKAHVKSIFSKLGTSTRTEASTVARARGLLNPIDSDLRYRHLSLGEPTGSSVRDHTIPYAVRQTVSA